MRKEQNFFFSSSGRHNTVTALPTRIKTHEVQPILVSFYFKPQRFGGFIIRVRWPVLQTGRLEPEYHRS